MKIIFWLIKKLESLFSAAFACVTSLMLSQFPEYLQQYLQRLGGHIDQMNRMVDLVVSGEVFSTLGPIERQKVAQDMVLETETLRNVDIAISNAPPLIQPWAFFTMADYRIVVATLENFQPAVPLSIVAMVYGLSGFLIGWLIWEIFKIPLKLLFRIGFAKKY